MFKSKLMILAAVAAVLGLSGCATQMVSVPVPGPDAVVLEKLAGYAQQNSLSMQRLASIQMDRTGATPVELKAPAGLDKPISITWTGPLEQLVKKISEMSGYSYEGVLGTRPVNTVQVSISVVNTSAFMVLADAGAQAGVSADIVIQPEKKAIIVKYPPTTPNGGYVAVQ